MKRARMIGVAVSALLAVALLAPIASAKPGFVFPGGCCFYEGQVVRTVVPPASFPNTGTDPFFAVVGGAQGQRAIVGVVPGDVGYDGGHWAFRLVTWNTTPYLLTSQAAVEAAAGAGHVSVVRDPARDFLCPIQL